MSNPAALEKTIQTLLPRVDLETTGLKQFMKLLSKEMGGVDLRHHKEFIKETLTDAISKLQQQNEQDHEDDNRDDDEDDDDDGTEADNDDDCDDNVDSQDDVEEESSTNARTPASRRGGGGGGLAAKKEISRALSSFLGKGSMMSRTEVVKSLWEYIREHDLQNPANKREILLDSRMKKVFGCDKFTMFTMNKYIGAHIDPFKPVDLTSSSSTPSKADASKKRKTKSSSGSAKKKRKAGTQPPYQLSEPLIAIVGKSILPRPQVVSAIWDYIKAHDLQNPEDKREILCDDKLRAVMHKSKVSMFQMNQLITPHLIEKVDRASYQHEEGGDTNKEGENDDASDEFED